jgi:hypothetical protein
VIVNGESFRPGARLLKNGFDVAVAVAFPKILLFLLAAKRHKFSIALLFLAKPKSRGRVVFKLPT